MNRTANREKQWTQLWAFLLPAILMVTVLALTGIFPFGEKSLLILDLDSEYVDYLAQMNESIRTGQSLMRSWNMGMGLNMLGLIAFYTSSPFNILIMIFPVEWITEVLLVITVLKVGLAGLLFAHYTDYVLKRRGLFAVIFATAWALNSYSIAYASNIMWLDGVAFLPLVLLGAEKILREGKWGIFLFSLIYIFFTSYYIAYMIGLFALLYFCATYFSKQRPLRFFWPKLGKFLGTAAVAAGCCAFLLLPAFLNLKNGQSQMWDIAVSFKMNHSFVRMATRLIPGVYHTLTDSGLPNIYSTVLGLLLCLVYFLHRSIPRREKLMFGSLLAFIGLSFSCDLLYMAWHAFEDPTWYPARFSFVFIFLVLRLAMGAAKELQNLTAAPVAGATLLLGVLFLEIGISRFSHVQPNMVMAAIALLAVYLILWHGFRSGQRGIGFVLLLVICTELWANAYGMEQGLDEQFTYQNRDSYTQYREKYSGAINTVTSLDDSIYRLEIVEQRSANGGMALGYNGISHYSTTTDQELNKFLRRLTYNKGTSNEVRFAPTTPLANGMLGIKYVLSQEDMGPGYDLLARHDSVGAYENSCAFPMAFWVEGSGDFDANFSNPFALQNTMVRGLVPSTGASIFTQLFDVTEELHNVDRDISDGYICYTPRVKGERAWVNFVISNPGEQEAYGFFSVWNGKFNRGKVFLDGVEIQDVLAYRRNSTIPLGSGREILLTLELGSDVTRVGEEFFYAMDLDAAQIAAAKARDNAFVFQTFTDTAVSGRVTAPSHGALATTFPYDSGWKVWVDGAVVETKPIAGVFLSVPLSEGEHLVKMKYTAPGFAAGCAVSAVSIAGLTAWLVRRRYLR